MKGFVLLGQAVIHPLESTIIDGHHIGLGPQRNSIRFLRLEPLSILKNQIDMN